MSPEDKNMSFYGTNYNRGELIYGYNTYGDDAFITLPYITTDKETYPAKPYILGTKDWATSKIDYSGGRTDVTKYDDNTSPQITPDNGDEGSGTNQDPEHT